MWKTCSRHKPSGWLHPQRGTRCPQLCCLFGLGRGCWGRVRTENRSRKSSSQVSPGSAPPSAPPRGCSPLALVAKPVSPECNEAHIAQKKHLPECRCWLPCTWLGESWWRDAPLHHISVEETRRKVPMLHVAPRAFCSHMGSILFRLQGFLPFSFFSSKDTWLDWDRMQLCSCSDTSPQTPS